MSTLRRLLLPAGLGLAAAVVNAGILQDHAEPEYLVGVNRNVAAGETIRETDLERIPVKSPRSRLEGHFWLWSERHPLLDGVPSAVNLTRGDLVPREPFLREAESPIRIGSGQVVVGVRVSPSAVALRSRHLLRPGTRVSLRLRHDDEVYQNLRLAWMELVDGGGSSADQVYQVGFLVPADEPLAVKILELGVASLEGLPD